MALGYDGCIRLPNCSGDHDSVHEMIYGGVSILMTVHSIDKTPFADKNGKKNIELQPSPWVRMDCRTSNRVEIKPNPFRMFELHEKRTFIHWMFYAGEIDLSVNSSKWSILEMLQMSQKRIALL